MKTLELESGGLLLRPLRMSEAPLLMEAVHESVASLRPYLFWASTEYSLDAARNFIRFSREMREEGRELHLGIFEAASGDLLGLVGLMRMKLPVMGFEIGYWMRSSRQGRGHMTEAVRRLIRHAFGELGAHRVWLNCDVRNRASRRVAEKLGMRREGRVRAFLVDPQGRPRDHYLFGMLKREFEA